MIKKVHIIILVAITFFNCGAGTFENDPETWYKVFGEDPPEQIQVINTRFWKSAHWSYEFELYAEFKASHDIINSLLLERYRFKETTNPMLDLGFADEKPKWFVSKDFEQYSIYESATNNMLLFRNSTSNTNYLYALQL
nr:hypothetical protein [uncultured Psychroserpens sp.]